MKHVTRMYLKLGGAAVLGLGLVAVSYHLIAVRKPSPPSDATTQAPPPRAVADQPPYIRPSASVATPTFMPRPRLPSFSHQPAAEDLVLEAVNAERTHQGLRPLVAEPTLRDLAREHCDDMLARRFFDHVNPDGQGPDERVAYGHRQLVGAVGENIWTGSGYPISSSHQIRGLAERIMETWIGSPGHRRNILSPDYTHLGVGVSVDGPDGRATQVFATVRAYTNQPIPLRVPRDSRLDLMTTPIEGGIATKYDLWSAADGQSEPEARSIGASGQDSPAGTFTLRFYFPDQSMYTIFPGPSVTFE